MALKRSSGALGEDRQQCSYTHTASIFKTDKEQREAVIPFILEGLERGEKCIYILDRSRDEEVLDALAGFADGDAIFREGQLIFLEKEDTYLKDGYFDPDRMLGMFAPAWKEAVDGGFQGLRATGEMSWQCSNPPGADRFIEYEARLNLLYPGLESDLLCQYDESSFDHSELMEVIHTHPRVVIRGEPCVNPYFIPPNEFLSRTDGAVSPEMYERTSLDILKRARLSMIHRLEMRDFRRTRERLATLESQILRDIESLVEVVSFYNELARDSCGDRVAVTYLDEVARGCVAIRKHLERARSREYTE